MFLRTGRNTGGLGIGRKRATTVQDDIFILLHSLRNPHLSSVERKNQLREVRGANECKWTVRRRLHQVKLKDVSN